MRNAISLVQDLYPQPLYLSLGDCTKSTNYNWYNRHFHVPQFFNSLARSMYLSFFLFSFTFSLWAAGWAKFTFRPVLFFLLIITRSCCLAQIISKFQRCLCVSFSRTDSRLCVYHLFAWSNFRFLHNSQWISLPTQSCLVLYSFCGSFFHSSLSPHTPHLLICCVLSMLVLIWLVLMAGFCAAIWREFVSLMRFPCFVWDDARLSFKMSIQLFFFTVFIAFWLVNVCNIK